ncbi:MAG: hypothetical protein PWQ97_1761 [Tepidanaerobacteraceae bacterium]|jgi:hypothetical protein|nr:hypothetical protein [Tepidanaerobacteraceae bacterium]
MVNVNNAASYVELEFFNPDLSFLVYKLVCRYEGS